MSNLLYFHGFNSNIEKSLSRHSLVDSISDKIFAFNAPNNGTEPGKFAWFSWPLNENVMTEIEKSVKFILTKIQELKIDTNDLILFGSSQGGFMALYLTLNNIIKPKKTIAAVPFYEKSLIHEKINKDTPILWMAAGDDKDVPKNVAMTWQDLKTAGANLDFKIDNNSTHGEWSAGFQDTIKKWSNDH